MAMARVMRSTSTLVARACVGTSSNSNAVLMHHRAFASSSRPLAAPWNLFPARQASAPLPQVPRYLSDWRHNLEFSLETMRLTEVPVGMLQLLNRNARRPKKANHGKRPCSHHRRRLKRLSRRSS